VSTGDDTSEFAAAGLYDPASANAAERLSLLRWLTAEGFSISEMRDAHATGELAALAGDSLRRSGVTLSIDDMSVRTGIDVEILVEIRRASGLGPVPHDVAVFGEDDVEAFELLIAAAQLFTWPELMHFLRVVGSSMSRVADAAISLFLHDVEHPLRRAGATELDVARRGIEAIGLAVGVSHVLKMMLRMHLDQSLVWSRQAARDAEGPRLMVPMSVGFVDLVGFTPRSASLDPIDLATLVARFEATAHDVITDLGGRLVKLIGDEVMYVAVEPATGCAIATALLRTFGGDPALTPRGGLAHGDVLSRGGDVFGPTVNLASRLAEQAVPGEVLTTPDVVHSAGLDLAPAGRRMLKGFDDPVEVVSLAAD
jgi:adenylate cyclase